jgi:hypothetical protein
MGYHDPDIEDSIFDKSTILLAVSQQKRIKPDQRAQDAK